jgi:2-phospho-L-lactate/phosphoenolpyruvate guanylyltransferase
MRTSTTALLPLRSPGRGKTRLASVLTPGERAALAGAMLADVAAAFRDTSVDEVIVVAGGPTAAAAASALGLDVLLDPPDVSSLDGALGAAAARLGRRAGLLVVAADLPAVTSEDLEAVLARATDVVIAPTRDGGTGALLRRPGDAITTAYGRGSAARHRQLARTAGRTVSVVRRNGLAHDVDRRRDLTDLRRLTVGPATTRLLATLCAAEEAAG